MSQTFIPWIAVAHLQEVSVRKLASWLNARGDFETLFVAPVAELIEFGFTLAETAKFQKINWQAVESELQWYESKSEIITILDPRYPALLKEIADPPLVLFAIGDVSLLACPQVAIVGTRNPSPIGEEDARLFAGGLAQQGLVITSGLASGIDGACHRGALEVQGKTIAVMGTGLGEIYPRRHQKLAESIMQNGLLLTEFPLHTKPAPWNFPRRNRIISGLSLGVLVVEAALRSGSLITARYANEQNREVFAIPGSVHNPLAKGCHQLISNGAKLVESVQNILEELPIKPIGLVSVAKKITTPDLSREDALLLQCIDYAATALDFILHRSGLTPTEVSSILLNLELAGYVRTVPGGYIRCI